MGKALGRWDGIGWEGLAGNARDGGRGVGSGGRVH